MTTPNRPPLSPAAQAVLDAYLKAPCDNRLSVAAALRALFTAGGIRTSGGGVILDGKFVLAIAAELEGFNE